jgi:tetratricopeptide (TPR) repeat protein
MNAKTFPHSRWIRWLMALIFFLIWGFPVIPARADVAPPEQSPGANPEPGSETTQVRMVDEVVIIDVSAEEPARAHITASFTMRNLGSQAESMSARFPLGLAGSVDNIVEIQNFGVRVNDKPVSFQRVMQEIEIYGQKVQMPWATFPVTFPAAENVLIKVSYDVYGTAWGYDNFVHFSYILETGAGWKDTIGSATIILRLPYEASEQNVLNLHANPAMSGISGREVTWTFKNLEPTSEDNFEVYIVKPVIWKQIKAEKENLARNPQDGEAWGRLGKAYKQSFTYPKPFCRDDGTSETLYALSKEAYEKAVSLKPEDALWHAGFADLLARSGQWDCPDVPEDRIRALQEIRLALEIAPKDPKVQEIADMISWTLPDGMVRKENGYDFPWLTQTPVPTETTVPATPEPAIATQAVPSPQPPTPTLANPANPAPNPQLPTCGSALILPLLALGLFLWRRIWSFT